MWLDSVLVSPLDLLTDFSRVRLGRRAFGCNPAQLFTRTCICYHAIQAVGGRPPRYAPPLSSPCGRRSALRRPPNRRQRSSSFTRPTCSHPHPTSRYHPIATNVACTVFANATQFKYNADSSRCFGYHAHRCSRLIRQHGGAQSGLVTLTFDLLTLKVVSESRVTWATSVPMCQ